MNETMIEAEARYLIQDRTARSRRPRTEPVGVRRHHRSMRRPSWL